MIDLNDLGNEIKNARKQRKLTREKLAELSGSAGRESRHLRTGGYPTWVSKACSRS